MEKKSAQKSFREGKGMSKDIEGQQEGDPLRGPVGEQPPMERPLLWAVVTVCIVAAEAALIVISF
tara:strand:- start:150 stop:344 length:195 start_codon:yes stop_codon:yes gene_type:complete